MLLNCFVEKEGNKMFKLDPHILKWYCLILLAQPLTTAAGFVRSSPNGEQMRWFAQFVIFYSKHSSEIVCLMLLKRCI